MLSLLSAVLLSQQCATGITDNAQTMCGEKTFSAPTHIGSRLYLRNGSFVFAVDGQPVQMIDTVPTSDVATPSFALETYYPRTAASPVFSLRVSEYEGGPADLVFMVRGDGTVLAPRFEQMGGHSGAAALVAPEGLYLPFLNRFPRHYQGDHGGATFSGEYPCEGYPMIQASNGRSDGGSRDDYRVNFSCEGGWYSQGTTNSYDLPRCTGQVSSAPEPNNRYGPCLNLLHPTDPPCNFGPCGELLDGGYCYDWTTQYGAPTAHRGETMPLVDDVGEGCQCVPAKYDGGVSPAGWFKLSDRTECKP